MLAGKALFYFEGIIKPQYLSLYTAIRRKQSESVFIKCEQLDFFVCFVFVFCHRQQNNSAKLEDTKTMKVCYSVQLRQILNILSVMVKVWDIASWNYNIWFFLPKKFDGLHWNCLSVNPSYMQRDSGRGCPQLTWYCLHSYFGRMLSNLAWPKHTEEYTVRCSFSFSAAVFLITPVAQFYI